jgi:hypothetical protein
VNSYTPKISLAKPAVADRAWGTTLNADFDLLDAQAALGSLAVTAAETPSTTRAVAVSAGSTRKSDGTLLSYAGGTVTLAASQTHLLWLDDAGALQHAGSWPSAWHTRLAQVVTGTTTVTSVTDQRIPWQSAGLNLNTVYLALAGGTLTGALTLAGAPTSSLHAATKAYVDAVTGSSASIGGSISGATAGRALYVGASGVLAQSGALSGLVKWSSGAPANAVAGTDYLAPNGSGAFLTGLSASNITGTIPAGLLPLTGVSPGTYTLSTITVDATGRVTAASSGSVSGAGMAIGDAIGNGSSAGDVLYVGSGGVLAQASVSGLVYATGTGLRAATGADIPVFGASGSGHSAGAVPDPGSTAGTALYLREDGTWHAPSGSGTVTVVSVVTANGVSGSVATDTSTPAITLTLGNITPSSVAASGTVTGSNLSGTNTGDATISLTGDVTGSGTSTFATAIGAGKVTNSMLAGSIPASKLVGTDVATVGTLTAGTWHATVIGPAYGGTGADLSATGGSGQYLKQSSAGAGVTVGAIAAADLPVFVASGSSHAKGAVPDPGSTAGTTKYLCEDGTWSLPSSTPFVASGTGHAAGAVPDPGATAGTTRFLREDGWSTLTGARIDSHYGAITTANSGSFNFGTTDKQLRVLDGTNGALSVSGGFDGQTTLLILKQDATGSRTVTWWTTITWPGAVVPTLSTGAGKIDVFSFLRTATGAYLGFVVGQNL